MTELIIFGAKHLLVIIVAIAVPVILLNKERRVKIGYVALIALPLGYALARLAGLFFAHNQPFVVEGFEPLIPHAIDNSFPSDHVALAGVFASAAFLADRRVGLVLWALTLLIGLARVLAGLHWGVDVLAAAVLAVAAVWLAEKALKAFKIY